jgi:hypothetical protein
MNDKGQAEQALREKAEEVSRTRAEEHTVTPVEMSAEEVRRLLHELRVHQIELEMQNAELRRTQTDLESERQRYFDLYEMAPVGYCTISEGGDEQYGIKGLMLFNYPSNELDFMLIVHD